MSTKFILSREMRALDVNAEYFGISRLQMMENAGQSVAAEIASRFKPEESRVAIFCGLGGNGGDGLVTARHLKVLGYKVEVVLAGRPTEITSFEALKNWSALQVLGNSMTLHEVHETAPIPDVEADVVVDALLGIGLKGPLRPPILHLVKKINAMKAFRVSIDVPSGIDSDSGEVLGDAIKADLTIALHKTKTGLLKAKKQTGEIIVRKIGLPHEIERFVGPGDLSLVVKPRKPNAHKGDFGRLMVVGGSEIFSGAPALVALAALRTGVDLTYIASPHKTANTISSFSPNLITIKLDGSHLNSRNIATIKRYIKLSNAIVIGPGLGTHKDTKVALEEILRLVEAEGIPSLLDADALKFFPEIKKRARSSTVLTPHAGEYLLLTGKHPPLDLEDRAIDVQKTAKKLGAVVLLKGRVDVISDGERVKLNFTGNPGMTVGGTGDTLSGIIGGLLAQKNDPFEATAAGAFINGAAGDLVKRKKGYHMVATDIVEYIPLVMDDPMSHKNLRE